MQFLFIDTADAAIGAIVIIGGAKRLTDYPLKI